MAMTNRAWQDGFVAMARLERCGPGRYCFHATEQRGVGTAEFRFRVNALLDGAPA
jgi:hypothetical protein